MLLSYEGNRSTRDAQEKARRKMLRIRILFIVCVLVAFVVLDSESFSSYAKGLEC
jgi:hypothetical protein